jgi:hypothetical protein
MPLLAMFPLADVPVVAMSVHPGLAAEEQYRIGRALAPLRERNVLIVGSGGMSGSGSGSGNKIGSGSCSGNKSGSGRCSASKPASGGGKVMGCGDAGLPFEFEEWLGEQLETWNTEALFDYERRAPCAREPVQPAFMAPLLRAMGAADRDGEAERLIIDGLDSETERLIFDDLDSEAERLIIDGLDSETERLIFDDEAELLHCDGLDSEEERLIFDGLDSLGVSGAPLICWRFGGSVTAG